MSTLSVPPYVLTDEDGSDPRIAFAVATPGAFVLVESRSPNAYCTRTRDHAGVKSALETVRRYAMSHRAALDLLYARLEQRPRSRS